MKIEKEDVLFLGQTNVNALLDFGPSILRIIFCKKAYALLLQPIVFHEL